MASLNAIEASTCYTSCFFALAAPVGRFCTGDKSSGLPRENPFVFAAQ